MRTTLILSYLLLGSLFIGVIVACRGADPTPTTTSALSPFPTTRTSIPKLTAVPLQPGTPALGTPTATTAPTPNPTPVPGPVWTLELTITPLELVDDRLRESRATGPDRLILGMNPKCERELASQRVGCLGPTGFPSLEGLDLVRVYICHPDSYPPNCSEQKRADGTPLPLLSTSFTSRNAIQKWVVEVAPTPQLKQITFSWDQARLRQQLEGRVDVRIVQGQDIIDIVQSTNNYTLVLGPESEKGSFLICSRMTGVPFQSGCPFQFP